MVFQSSKFSYPLIDLFKEVISYRGTRDANAVRTADQQARTVYSDDLTALQRRIEAVAKELAIANRLAEVQRVEELAAGVRHLADRVRTATYGYAGVAAESKPDGTVMAQLAAFDAALIGGLEGLSTQVGQIEAAVAGGQDLSGSLRAASDTLRALHQRFDLRGRVIESGKPVDAAAAADVLRPASANDAPEAWALDLGRAVTVAGARHVVDGKIGITTAYGGFRLFRLSGDPGAWLMSAGGPNFSLGVVREVPAPAAGTPLAVDGVPLTSTGSLPGKGEPVGPQGSGGVVDVTVDWLNGPDGKVGMVITWGSSQQAFAGTLLTPGAVVVDMTPRGE